MLSRIILGRSSFLFVLTSCFLFLVLVPRYQAIEHEGRNLAVIPRALLSSGPSTLPPTNTATSSPIVSTPPTTTTTSSPSQISVPLSIPQILPSSSDTTTTTPSSTPAASSAAPSSTSIPETTSQIQTTNSNGQPITTVITVPASPVTSAPPASSSNAGGGGSSTLSSGSIIGLSVCGGVAAFGIVAFIIWKLSRKRASDRFDDSEAIKWPELNSGNHTDGFSSEVNLTRSGTSPAGYEASIGTASQSHVDLYTADPYAVPPLPHLNPGHPQPYRDDPNAGSYYDAYPGAIPADYRDNSRVEAIPMTQIPLGNRTRSPGPQMGFSGRASPASAMGRQSPGPQAAYGYR